MNGEMPNVLFHGVSVECAAAIAAGKTIAPPSARENSQYFADIDALPVMLRDRLRPAAVANYDQRANCPGAHRGLAGREEQAPCQRILDHTSAGGDRDYVDMAGLPIVRSTVSCVPYGTFATFGVGAR